MNPTIKKIFGPPGTGKTTRMLDLMETELASGVLPTKIAFCSFTKKAADEALERAGSRFSYTPKDLPYVRTLHSLAFRLLGVNTKQILDYKHLKKIGSHLGLTFTHKNDIADFNSFCHSIGDRFLFIDQLARSSHRTPKDVWDEVKLDGMNWYEFERYRDTVAHYKRQNGLYDFADLLEQGARDVDIEVLFLDEAQDLSKAQWRFVKKTFRNAKRIYLAGDDDQAIYEWAGASVSEFLSYPTDDVEVLSQSWRVPRAIHAVAHDIVRRIEHRQPKDYLPSRSEGLVNFYRSIDHLDFSSGSWMILSRNVSYLERAKECVRHMGFAYTLKGVPSIDQDHVKCIRAWENWRSHNAHPSSSEMDLIEIFLPKKYHNNWPRVIWHDALSNIPLVTREYYISCLRNSERLTDVPRITISTIHGVKGGEADHVALMTDMSASTWRASRTQEEAEHRVWYVGCTRARQSLNIILPSTGYYYTI